MFFMSTSELLSKVGEISFQEYVSLTRFSTVMQSIKTTEDQRRSEIRIVRPENS